MTDQPGTWRAALAEASAAVPAAYLHRRAIMRAAHDAGLSLRQIAAASDLSLTAVSHIVGPVGRVRRSLDEPIGQS